MGDQLESLQVMINELLMKQFMDFEKRQDEKITALQNQVTTQVTALQNQVTTQVTALQNQVTTQVTALQNQVTTQVTALQNQVTTQVTALQDQMAKNHADQQASTGALFEILARKAAASFFGAPFMEQFLVRDVLGFCRLALPKNRLLPKENPIYNNDVEIQQMRANTLVTHIFGAKLLEVLSQRLVDFEQLLKSGEAPAKKEGYQKLLSFAQNEVTEFEKFLGNKDNKTQDKQRYLRSRPGLGVLLITAAVLPPKHLPPFYREIECDFRGEASFETMADSVSLTIHIGEAKLSNVKECFEQLELRCALLEYVADVLLKEHTHIIHCRGTAFMPSSARREGLPQPKGVFPLSKPTSSLILDAFYL